MRRSLGKGIGHLIAGQIDAHPAEVPIERIVPNGHQPRTTFDGTALAELAASIKAHGVLQPLAVRETSRGSYELIAGERRLRAAALAGLAVVPIVVRDADPKMSLELALVENLQREDIAPLECARAYRELTTRFGLTQEQVAERVGKSRAAVANTLRLLKLPKRILDGLDKGSISEGHARALLGLPNEAQMLATFDQVIAKGLSVREVEEAAKRAPRPRPPAARRKAMPAPDIAALEGALSTHFGTPVTIVSKGSAGQVRIAYYSDEDLQRLTDQLGVSL